MSETVKINGKTMELIHATQGMDIKINVNINNYVIDFIMADNGGQQYFKAVIIGTPAKIFTLYKWATINDSVIKLLTSGKLHILD